MKRNIIGPIIGIMAVLTCRELSADEAQKMSLPVELNQIIDEALEIKQEAMGHRNMRSFELVDGQEPNIGIAGKRFNGIMDQISEARLSEDVVKSASELQYSDIRAKIIVWSLDRKARRMDYDRFAKYYVNRPSHKEAEEYFSRLSKKNPPGDVDPFAESSGLPSYIPRPGGWRPDSVDEEDKNEKFRLIMEYCFYAPPEGLAFDDDAYRSNMACALIDLGHYEKSLIVMASDAEIALSAKITESDEDYIRSRNEYGFIYFLTHAPIEPSFSVIAKASKATSVRQATKKTFDLQWYFPYHMEYHKMKKSYDAWQTLARKEWQSPEEQEFAKWLQSFDPPKDPSAAE